MTTPYEGYSNPSPLEVLGATIRNRQEQQEELLAAFGQGLELAGNLDRVNEILAASARPDLVMTNRVEVMPVQEPKDLRKIDNFRLGLRATGVRTMGTEPGGHQYFTGYRQADDTEWATIFYLGARGGYNEHMAFAADSGADQRLAEDLILQTHIGREAFVRMWILFPELTRTIVNRCIEYDDQATEEVFVAYNLMARLVDANVLVFAMLFNISLTALLSQHNQSNFQQAAERHIRQVCDSRQPRQIYSSSHLDGTLYNLQDACDDIRPLTRQQFEATPEDKRATLYNGLFLIRKD